MTIEELKEKIQILQEERDLLISEDEGSNEVVNMDNDIYELQRELESKQITQHI